MSVELEYDFVGAIERYHNFYNNLIEHINLGSKIVVDYNITKRHLNFSVEGFGIFKMTGIDSVYGYLSSDPLTLYKYRLLKSYLIRNTETINLKSQLVK